MSHFLDTHPDVIDLQRRYQPVPLDQEELDSSSILSTVALMQGEEQGQALKNLLAQPLTVILGEARSGKTTELRLTADQLRADGQAAFFVRIEDLSHAQASTESVAAALELDAEDAFVNWLSSGEEGVFFLDSVDEAKIQNVGDYRRAMRTFQKSLRPHLHRIRLVASCRVTEWRPKNDVAPLRELLPFLAKPRHDGEKDQEEDDAEVEPRADAERDEVDVVLVQILPLDKQRIKQLADARGLADVTSFLEAVHDADAEEFAGRPGDALDLIDVWQDQKRLGSLSELTVRNVFRKLTEEAEAYKDVISPGRAREGAERLAAASMLCGEASFRFAKPEQDPQDALPALNPYELLPDWSTEEVEALLRRPIFDEATYGRVRFHTKGVREYLAASWFRRRYTRGCPPCVLVGIFFIQRCGCTVINPALTSVAAWLAPHVPELMNAVLEHNPEILPDEGDPQAIPTNIRGRVLRDYAHRYAGRERTGHQFDRNGLRRFAHEDLAETINELLLAKDTPHDVRALMLDLVEVRKIKACAGVVSRIALNQGESSNIRVDALAALRACDAVDALRQVYDQMLKTRKVSKRLFGWAIYELFPVAINAGELLHLIEKAQSIFSAPFEHVEDLLERRLDQEEGVESLRVLIPVLLDWVRSSVPGRRGAIGPRYWLYGGLCICVEGWLKQSDEITDWLFPALDLIEDQPSGDYRTGEAIKKITEHVLKKPPEFRKAFMEHRYAAHAAKNAEGDIHYFQLKDYQGFFNLVSEDIPWLLDMVDQTGDERMRFTAFNTAVDLSYVRGEGYTNAETLESRARPYPHLFDHWQKAIAPRPRRVWDYMHEIRGWSNQLRKRWRRVQAQKYFLPRLHEIAACKKPNDLANMYDWMRHSGYAYSSRDPESLEPLFGKQGVEAYRQGLKAYWRTWDVSPEKPDGTTKVGDHMSLVGVACDVADGLDFARLDQATAQRLTYLAFKELHLPPWFTDLVRHHEETVKAIVCPWLESDLALGRDSQAYASILSDISMSPPEVLAVFLPFIRDTASLTMPLAVHVRSAVIRMFAEQNGGRDLAQMASSYLRNKRALDGLQLFWCAIWFQTDAVPAFDWLEDRLSKFDEERTKEAVTTFASLLDTFHISDAVIPVTPDYKSVAVLRRLIPIIHRYLPSDETPHHHGVFTPGRRDAAYSFRGTLVNALADIDGDEAYHALLEIRDQTKNAVTRDWITSLAERKIGRDGQHAWLLRDVLEFEEKHEHVPRTADDLFEIGLKRLMEIKDKLVKGDTSLRDLFNAKTDESVLQKYVAERLGELARGRYAVVREAEVDDKKEPDIRLLFGGIDSTTIEIKWAHKWRLVELEKALTDQLVGQYLKAANSAHGVLLVVNADSGKSWSKRGMKKPLNFVDLIEHLSRIALQIESATPGVARLAVVGIDVSI